MTNGLQALRTLVPRFLYRGDTQCPDRKIRLPQKHKALKCAVAKAGFLAGFYGTTESRALLPAAAKAQK